MTFSTTNHHRHNEASITTVGARTTQRHQSPLLPRQPSLSWSSLTFAAVQAEHCVNLHFSVLLPL
jgi:hypothetical protein